jgi:hypothetical protein
LGCLGLVGADTELRGLASIICRQLGLGDRLLRQRFVDRAQFNPR